MNPNSDWHLWTLPTDRGGMGRQIFINDAARGYTLALEDVARLREVGAESYRFSVEWSRIEPRRDEIDEAALAHYGRIIDALVAAGIRPMITVHHFSSPVWIDDARRGSDCPAGPTDTDLCGWARSDAREVIEEIAEFAQLLAQRFGDRVDEWCTVNEPSNYILLAYGLDRFPPGRNLVLTNFDGVVQAFRNYIGAHAAMVDRIRLADTIDADGDGSAAVVGYAAAVSDFVPARNNQESTLLEDVAARDRLAYVYNDLFTKALVSGAFDANLDGTAEEPHPEWRDRLDWLGLQYYFKAGVTGSTPLIPVIRAVPCYGGLDFGSCLPLDHPTKRVPEMSYEFSEVGMYNTLIHAHETFPGLPLVVTEAGIATKVGRRRSEHIVRILEQIARAQASGVDVRGYYHWTLTDNFEWSLGFGPKFGLFSVDFSTFQRTPTESVPVLRAIATTHSVTAAQRMMYGGLGAMTPEQ